MQSAVSTEAEAHNIELTDGRKEQTRNSGREWDNRAWVGTTRTSSAMHRVARWSVRLLARQKYISICCSISSLV